MFGLNRRRRGALVGHLAAVRDDVVAAERPLRDGLRRLGFDRTATEFFDVHVEADAVHEQIAAVDLCGGLLAAEPHLRADVLLGAATALHLDARASAHLYDAWQAQRTSLRTPVTAQDACA
jgi:hypothetical protein